MSTTIHAGNGRDRLHRLKGLFPILVSLQLTTLQASESDTSVAMDWRLATQFSLARNEHNILLLEQQGADLVLQLRSGEDIILTQDSPDGFFGTEVLVAENAFDEARSYGLYVRDRLAAADYDFSLERITEPDQQALATAKTLSLISELWWNDPQDPQILTLQQQLEAPVEGSRLNSLAYWYWAETLLHTSQYERLLTFLEDNRSHLTNRGDELATLYYGWLVSRAFRGLDRIEEALAQYENLAPSMQALQSTGSLQARLLRESVRGDWGMAEILLGLKLGDQEIMHAGAEKIEWAIARSEPLNDYELLGDLTNYLYAYESMLGLRGDAMATLGHAESYYARSGNLASLATVKNNQAFNQRAIGDLSGAQRSYREALRLLQDTANYRGYATVLSRLALTYSISGDYYRAETLFEEAISRFRELSLTLPALQAEIELGVVYRMQSRYEDAIALQVSLAQRLQSDTWLDEYVRVHAELARNYLLSGHASLAAPAIALNGPLRDLTTRLAFGLEAYAVEIEYLIVEGQLDAARALASRALDRISAATAAAGGGGAQIIIEPEQQLEILHQLVKVELAEGNWRQATELAERTIVLVNTVRNAMDFERQGPTWHAKTRRVIDTAAMMNFDRYLATDQPEFLEQAFNILQSNNSISLYANRQHAIRQSRSESQTDAEEDLLWKEMLGVKRRLLESAVQGEVAAELELEAAMAEEAYKTVQADLVAAVTGLPDVLTVEALQARLRADQGALLFSLSEDRGHVVFVSRQDLQVGVLPGAGAVGELVESALAEITGPGSRRFAVNTQALSERLLAGIAIPDQVTSLLIESNGLLSLVPFAVLPDPQQGNTVALIDRFLLTRTPSLSLYYQERQNATLLARERADISIFADPDIPAADSTPGEYVNALVLNEGWQNTLAPLPNTAAEAHAIQSRFAADTARVHTGAEATMANFLAAPARKSRILHVATHGFANSYSPDFIGLLFSAGDTRSSGFLTYTDIKEYHFANELVVINGCETAAGEMLPGEGMMGLSRTFLSRGAKATIATLWPVSDAASARFMAYFYEDLTGRAGSAAEALRNAQLRLRASPQYRSPFYWGAYTLDVADASLQPIAQREQLSD